MILEHMPSVSTTRAMKIQQGRATPISVHDWGRHSLGYALKPKNESGTNAEQDRHDLTAIPPILDLPRHSVRYGKGCF